MPNADIGTIKKTISTLTQMKELPVKDFTSEGGYAHVIVMRAKNELKATQLRRFFDGIKKACRQAKHNPEKLDAIRTQLMLMRPTLAYAKARKLIPDDFYEIVRDCLEPSRLRDAEDFERLSQFMEAIVAYHKFIGGK